MTLQFHLQSSNYNPTPENRLERAKNFANTVKIWQKNPQALLNIKHDQFTIDDYYQQSMLLTKAFCLVQGLEHNIISQAILKAYAQRDLKANTENFLKTDENDLKHVSVKHQEFAQKILKAVRKTIGKKADNIESLNTQASSMIENLFKDSDVIPYYLLDYIGTKKQYPNSNLPAQEGLRDKGGNLLPEALMRLGRAFETEYSIKMMRNVEPDEKETLEKLNNGLEKMINTFNMRNMLDDICNFNPESVNGRSYPSIDEKLSNEHNFVRLECMGKDKNLTIQQLRVLHLCVMLPHLTKYPAEIKEKFKAYFDLIEDETFILHHIRQKFFSDLCIEKDFYQVEPPEGNPPYKLGIRERTCSQNSIAFENNDIEINKIREEQGLKPLEPLKIRIPDRLRPKEDYKGYMSEALETGTAFLKLPSGTIMVCMSTPFILKEQDAEFSFSAQDFKNLFKMMTASLTVCSGHSELDCLAVLPLFLKVIKDTYGILSQRCQGIFEPIAHQDILKYIGRENANISQETKYKELSPEERKKAEKLATNYKEMIGHFLEAFYTHTDIEDLDNIDPEKDFKYKHQLFIAGELNDERITKTWDKVNYTEDLEAEFKRLKASHKRDTEHLSLEETSQPQRIGIS